MHTKTYMGSLAPESSPSIFLTENFSLQQRLVKERLSEIIFEGLCFSKLRFTLSASNMLFAKGLTSGLIVDVGEMSSTMTPIVEGFIMANGVHRSASMSGQVLLDSLIEQLQQ